MTGKADVLGEGVSSEVQGMICDRRRGVCGRRGPHCRVIFLPNQHGVLQPAARD